MDSGERSRALGLADVFVREACALEDMAKNWQLTDSERVGLRGQAHAKLECARRLRMEMAKVCRAR